MPDIDFGQLSEALNDKMDRDANNAANEGKQNVVAWGMPDMSRQTTLTVSTTPAQATYNMFISGGGTNNAYFYVGNSSNYDPNDDTRRRIGFANGSTNEWQAGSTFIAKGQWYYWNGQGAMVMYACPLKGE